MGGGGDPCILTPVFTLICHIGARLFWLVAERGSVIRRINCLFLSFPLFFMEFGLFREKRKSLMWVGGWGGIISHVCAALALDDAVSVVMPLWGLVRVHGFES